MKPLIIYYHVYFGDFTKIIVQTQINKLIVSGLYSASEKIVISVAGGGQGDHEWISKIANHFKKMELVFHEGKADEKQTLLLLSAEAKQRDAYFLYLHTKGVTNWSFNVNGWREMMEYYSVHLWKDQVEKLDSGYDVVGIYLMADNQNPNPYLANGAWHPTDVPPHFSGGIWWSKSEYINRLNNTLLDNNEAEFIRFGAEFWISSAEQKNLFCPHYYQHYNDPYFYDHNITTYINDASITNTFIEETKKTDKTLHCVHADYFHQAFPKAPVPLVEPIQEQSRELIEIMQKNNTYGFNSPGGTDKDTFHSYTGAYEFLLSPYKNREIDLLEIGVQYGGSSLLWHDYLPQAKLVLVDMYNSMHPSISERMIDGRWNYYIADAYIDETVSIIMQKHPKGFDVALDDGPHTLETQILFIQKYLPYMKPGGIMIIEDIQSQEDLKALFESVPDKLKNNVRIIDLRSIKGRYDDLMFVLHI